MGKSQFDQVELYHKGIDEADRVHSADVVVEGFREEGHLLPVVTFDVTHRPPPGGQAQQHGLPYTTPDSSHSLSLEPRKERGICV
jgi:hypothetical protein